MIAAIVLAVTAELLAYTFEVLTSKFLVIARLVLGITELVFVATVAAIVIMIAQPTAIQTPSIFTRKLIVGARSWSWAVVQSYILISPINTIRISVT